jgi:hypothetical protein
MLYVLFNEEGKQINLADDERLIDSSWQEIPEDFEFDINIEQLLLVKGEFQKEPIPPYVEPPYYRIYDYMSGDYDKWAFPGDFPFDILGFKTKSFVAATGFRTKTIYYVDEEMTDSIVKVEYEFILDEGKPSLNKSPMKISFRMSDGSWSLITKYSIRHYKTSLEKQRELEIRRNNIVDQLKGLADQMGLLPQMNKLFEDYGSECFQYLKSGSPSLKKAIESDTKTPWLNANLPNGKPARVAISQYLSVGLV